MEGRKAAAGNFFGLGIQERDAMMAREDCKRVPFPGAGMYQRKKGAYKCRAYHPGRDAADDPAGDEETSKLMKHVSVQQVSGTTRQNIMGEIPEGIWDEMCASIKELDMAFYNMEMDGYKVSGYFAVCNAILEDSDVALAAELINALGRALGKALDKAILYGKM